MYLGMDSITIYMDDWFDCDSYRLVMENIIPIYIVLIINSLFADVQLRVGISNQPD